MPNRTLSLTALLLLAAVALGGCETTGSPGPQAAAAPQPITHQQAALDCWMGTEHLARTMSLDQRADLVDKCIDEKMKGEPAPMLAAPKPEARPKTASAKPAAAQASSPAKPAAPAPKP